MRTTELFELLKQRKWELINWELLTPNSLKVKNREGETILHMLANNDRLSYVPNKFLEDTLLSQEDNKGESVYFSAAKGIDFDVIPKELLTQETLLKETKHQETLLLQLIRSEQLELVPKTHIHNGILKKECASIATTYLHYCMYTGEFKKLPPETIDEVWGLKDQKGNTLLHAAAEGDKLNEIPLNDLTIRLSTEVNNYNQCALHLVSELNKVPKEFLTKKNLLIPDHNGQTPLHKSTWINGTDYLPIDVIDEEVLLTRDKEGKSPLFNLLVDYCGENQIKFSKILEKINHNKLKEALKEMEPILDRRHSDSLKKLIVKIKKKKNFLDKVSLEEKTFSILD